MIFLDLPIWQYIVITLILTHITVESVTIFLHRHQAHSSLELHPIASHFFRLWLWLTTGMNTKQWVAVHRKHHATVETKSDPHSPVFKGILGVVFGGVILYHREAQKADTLEKFGRGTPDDWMERYIYKYSIAGTVIMLGVNLLILGIAGLYIWLVQIVWIPFWAAGIINGVGHFWGYRNHNTADNSKNIVPIGIALGGEELHNNHHKFPWSARFSHRFWEVDITWLYLKILENLRLAKNLKTPDLITA